MFEYKDVASMSRIEALTASQDARAYWKFLYNLEKLWSGFGENAWRLIEIYQPLTDNQKLFRILQQATDLHALKQDQIIDELKKCDEYIATLNEKLNDGAMHFTAKQIGQMTNE